VQPSLAGQTTAIIAADTILAFVLRGVILASAQHFMTTWRAAQSATDAGL